MAGKAGLLKRKHNQGTAAHVAGKSAAEIKAELDGVAGVQTISLEKIRIDGGTQIRVELNNETVTQYADAMQDGAKFPALECTFDGSSYWLTDGFHRFHALSKTNAKTALVEVKTGTKRDAVLAAIGANAAHGLQRSNADKRRAVETLLGDGEWSQWSAREIAKAAAVDHKTVSKIRAEMSGGEFPHVVKGADGKEYKRPAKPAKKKPANAKEKAAITAIRNLTKADAKAVAKLAKGKDLEAAKAAIAWLTKYVEAIEK